MKTLTRWAAVGLVGLLLVGPVWGEDVYRPEVPILKVAHVGEPVPGIPGATFDYLLFPEIDGAGNVLLTAWMVGPGIDYDNDAAIWCGPPGAIEMVAREGDQAPDMPPGVVYVDVTAMEVVSETGLIAFVAYVAGPGIVEGENDGVIYCGYPGEFQKVFQTGDPVPEIGPDVYVDATQSFGPGLTDSGLLFVGAGLCGSGVSGLYTRAYWLGPPDDLQLMVWEGMPAAQVACPGCHPDVVMLWVGTISFNDAGQMAFLGGLSGPGITPYNDNGRWLGSPGNWELLHRDGDVTPEFGVGVTIRSATGIGHSLNRHGDKANRIRLQGPGITSANDWVLLGGQPEPMEVIGREGELVPEAGEGVYVESISAGGYTNDLHQMLYCVKFGGDSIDASNRYGIFFGWYNDAKLILRNGEAVGYFPSGTVFHNVVGAADLSGMNDVGDFFASTQIALSGGEAFPILGMWCGLIGQYVPVVEPGDELYGRTVTTDELGYLGRFWTLTGGADGLPQSFNDLRQLGVLLNFTDGTTGVYRIGPPLLGDIDGDGVVTGVELAAFADCVTYPGGQGTTECAAFDLDLDGDIDLEDFRLLQGLVGEVP